MAAPPPKRVDANEPQYVCCCGSLAPFVFRLCEALPSDAWADLQSLSSNNGESSTQNGPAVRSDSLVERSGFELPVLFVVPGAYERLEVSTGFTALKPIRELFSERPAGKFGPKTPELRPLFQVVEHVDGGFKMDGVIMPVSISSDDIEAVYPRVAKAIAAALARDTAEVRLESLLIADLEAESIDLLDIIFRLAHEFNVQIPRGQFIEDAPGDLSEAEFEDQGVLTDAET